MTSLFLFIGTTELLLIGGIALLLFGGKKLPEMMRGLGQGVKEFKKGVNEVDGMVDSSDSGDRTDDAKDSVCGEAMDGGNKVKDEAKGQQ